MVRRMKKTGQRTGAGILLVLLSSAHLQAQDSEWTVDWDALAEIGNQVQEQIAKNDTLQIWMQNAMGQLAEVLQGDEWASLGASAEYAHEVETYLKQFPEAEPFLSWLEQRLDYFDYAATRPPPSPPPPPVRSRPLPNVHGPVIGSTPPATPDTPALPTPDAELDYWTRKISSRPAPKQAAALAPTLKTIFESQGVPGELIWLAEVESTFNPKAESPVGARGLFQFMPPTAKQYGLSLAPRDERIDPEKSAAAAATYLKYLYRKFDDWPLAIAAYNAGEGRVGRTLRQHQASRFDEIATRLPKETRLYVPKVLATVRVREGIDPRAIPAPR